MLLTYLELTSLIYNESSDLRTILINQVFYSVDHYLFPNIFLLFATSLLMQKNSPWENDPWYLMSWKDFIVSNTHISLW